MTKLNRTSHEFGALANPAIWTMFLDSYSSLRRSYPIFPNIQRRARAFETFRLNSNRLNGVCVFVSAVIVRELLLSSLQLLITILSPLLAQPIIRSICHRKPMLQTQRIVPNCRIASSPAVIMGGAQGEGIISREWCVSGVSLSVFGGTPPCSDPSNDTFNGRMVESSLNEGGSKNILCRFNMN